MGLNIAEAVLVSGDRLVATARDPGRLEDLVKKYGDPIRTASLDVADVANRMLSMVLMTTRPAKKITSAESSPLDTFPTPKRMYPTTRLNSAQTTFTVGDDNPLPGG